MSSPAPRTASAWVVGGGAALLVLAAAYGAFGLRADGEPTAFVMGLIFALALAPALARAAVTRNRSALALVGASLALALVYASAHWVLGLMVVPVAPSAGASMAGSLFVTVAFSVLFLVQAIVLTAPRGRFARAIFPACFAGFYLDEIFTRLTFRLWPPASLRRLERTPRVADAMLTEVTA